MRAMELLESSPVIAAVKDENGLKRSFESECQVVFILYGNICSIEGIVRQVKEQGKTAIVHADLTAGLSQKEVAVDFIRQNTQADGIISTKASMLKAARKYAWKKKTGRYEFIAMEGSFHGRSMGALSVTEHEAYRTPFEPLIPGVKFAKFNDLDSVKALISDNTCAIILEPIQGEGGINMADPEFLKGIRKLCDEEGILLLFDEIQCGMGRTGQMFAWQYYGVKPDMMSMAKAIGSGVPVGAFAMTEDVAKDSLEPGDHGTTYGGNPLVCTAVAKTLEIFEKERLTEHVKEIGAYLEERLDELAASEDTVLERRGTGLIQGIRLTKPAGEVTARAMEEGLVIITARSDVIRFVPPMVITKEHVDEMIEKLKKSL